MIRVAALITAVVLSGCAGQDNLPVSNPDVTPVETSIYTALPLALSDDLRSADARFDGLSEDQIGELMFSVIQTIGCTVSTNPQERAAQYGVFGFSAYRSVRLDVADYEAWANEDSANAALWSDHKFQMGRKLHQRASASPEANAFLVVGDDGLISTLSSCGGINGL